SMTTMSPFLGSTPNWTFDPPVSTPISRMIRTAASRMRWYSLSESVMADGTHRETPLDNLLELFPVIRDIPAGSTHGERRPNDRRKSDLFEHFDGLFTIMRGAAGRNSQPDSLHRVLEGFSVLGLMNRLGGR